MANKVARLAVWKGWQCGKARGMVGREREREREREMLRMSEKSLNKIILKILAFGVHTVPKIE